MPSLMEILGQIGHVVDTPGAYTRGALAGRFGERVSGRDLLGLEDTEGAGAMAASLGAEMLLDPLNILLAAPVLARGLARSRKVGSVARSAAEMEAAKEFNRGVAIMLEDLNFMPERMAEETLFRKSQFIPNRPDEEIAEAFLEAYPVPRGREQGFWEEGYSSEELARIARHMMEQDPLPAEALRLIDEGMISNDVRSNIDQLEDIFVAQSGNKTTWKDHLGLEPWLGETLDRALEVYHPIGARDVRAIRGAEEGGLGLEEEPLRRLIDMFDEVSEPSRAYHRTRAPEEEFGRFSDLLTPGMAVPHSTDANWVGLAGYLAAHDPILDSPLYGERVLRGFADLRNPLVIPHDRYGPTALSKFIAENMDHHGARLFDDFTDTERAAYGHLRGEPTEAPSADFAKEFSDIDKQHAEFAEFQAFHEAGQSQLDNYVPESWGEAAETLDKSTDEMLSDYAQIQMNNKASGKPTVSLSEWSDEIVHGPEEPSLSPLFSEDLAEDLAPFVDDVWGKSQAMMDVDDALHPRNVAEVARRHGYDSVVVTGPKTGKKYIPSGGDPPNVFWSVPQPDETLPWADELLMELQREVGPELGYREFRGAILESPDFWREVSLLYPETSERLFAEAGHELGRTAAGRSGELEGLGQVYEAWTSPEKMLVPSLEELPPLNIRKEMLIALGPKGILEVLRAGRNDGVME